MTFLKIYLLLTECLQMKIICYNNYKYNLAYKTIFLSHYLKKTKFQLHLCLKVHSKYVLISR